MRWGDCPRKLSCLKVSLNVSAKVMNHCKSLLESMSSLIVPFLWACLNVLSIRFKTNLEALTHFAMQISFSNRDCSSHFKEWVLLSQSLHESLISTIFFPLGRKL